MRSARQILKEYYFRCRRKAAHLLGHPRAVNRWSNRLASSRVVSALVSRFDSSFPPSVNLELNTDCNYKCPFCPQSSFQRPVRYITRDGFRRVLDELKSLDFSGLFVLSVNNEPFLHPLLPEFCRLVSDELPEATVALISNGSLIREEDLRQLASFERPPRITVDDYTPDQRVVKRLQSWIAQHESTRLPIEFKQRSWNEIISNRAGNQPGMATHPEDYHDVACAWPFGGLFLNPELKAFLCCSDYQYEMIVGDLNRQSLMEIWKSPALQRVREAMLVPDRSQIPLCARCDAEWWKLPAHCERGEGSPRRARKTLRGGGDQPRMGRIMGFFVHCSSFFVGGKGNHEAYNAGAGTEPRGPGGHWTLDWRDGFHPL